MFKCSFCEFKLPTKDKSRFKTHFRKHTETCLFCDRKFCKKFTAQQHMAKCHPDKTIYRCSGCNRLFSKSEDLREHESIDCSKRRSFECVFCKYRHRLWCNLKSHMKKVHLNNGKCKICKQIMRASSLKGHMLRVHQVNLSFECSYCKEKFTRSKLLRNHEKRCKSRTLQSQKTCQAFRVECHICKTSSANIKTLKEHMTLRHLSEDIFNAK